MLKDQTLKKTRTLFLPGRCLWFGLRELRLSFSKGLQGLSAQHLESNFLRWPLAKKTPFSGTEGFDHFLRGRSLKGRCSICVYVPLSVCVCPIPSPRPPPSCAAKEQSLPYIPTWTPHPAAASRPASNCATHPCEKLPLKKCAKDGAQSPPPTLPSTDLSRARLLS